MRSLFTVILILAGLLLNAQCDTRPDPSIISNKHRSSIARSFGSISQSSIEFNKNLDYYYSGEGDTLFALGFSKSLWFSALDQDSIVRMSVRDFPDFRATNQADFHAGPLDEDTGLPIEDACDYFNRIWTIHQIDLERIKELLENGFLTRNDIPKDVLEWPALGNPHFPGIMIEQELAPYYDLNQDGIYDPLDGDWPLALEESKDFIPKSFSFSVFNDATSNPSTNSFPLFIEVHTISYVISCQGTAAEHAVFHRINYQLRNEALELSNLRVSLFEDNDLGCTQQKYFGCDTTMNAIYTYKPGGQDFGWCDSQKYILPENVGAIRSTLFLDNKMESAIYNINCSIADPHPAQCHYRDVDLRYNFVGGKWANGLPFTKKFGGFNLDSEDTTKFAFPDSPLDVNGWSMNAENLSIWPYRTLANLRAQGERSGQLNLVDHMLFDLNNTELEVFNIWPLRMEELEAEYLTILDGSFPCMNVTALEEESKEIKLTVQPNPVEDRLKVFMTDNESGELKIYNSMGQCLRRIEVINEQVIEFDTSNMPAGLYHLLYQKSSRSKQSVAFVKA